MSTKTIAFFGASGGCGLSALQYALADGHHCIALCRMPSKLTDQFPADRYPNLTVVPGNAHDVAAVSRCLVHPSDPKRIVDHVLSSIGGVFIFSKLTLDDPHVCERGIDTLLLALADVRARGALGRPQITAVTTKGISKAGRDLPLVMSALFHVFLGVPHLDKEAVERKLIGSGEDFVIVRPSLLMGEEDAARDVRVGVEDVSGGRNVVEKKEWGNTISKADVGRWIYQNLLSGSVENDYLGKAVGLTW